MKIDSLIGDFTEIDSHASHASQKHIFAMNTTIDGLDLRLWVTRDLGKPARVNGRGAWWCCPFHQDKSPSFLVSQEHAERGRYHCFGCGADGDAIDYVRKRQNCGYTEALAVLGLADDGAERAPVAQREPEPERLTAPCAAWQDRGIAFVMASQAALWVPDGARALAWLRDRGFSDDVIGLAMLGYNAQDRYDDRAAWGLAPEIDDKGRPRRVWLPRGVVIPWEFDGSLWRVNVRRPAGDPKYIGPAGSANGLYGADALRCDRSAVILEGELDALTVRQHAGDLVTPVATGSTGGARRVKWLSRLAACARVLVAFDSDPAGDEAAQYWLGALPNAARWRAPWGKDANGLATAGGDVRAWIAAGCTV